jgi:NTE family protein
MDNPTLHFRSHPLHDRHAQTVLVLQGGGALGAYQAGAYEALSECGFEPDWLSGISIGSINSAIIAGNEPQMRVARLREFWEQVTTVYPWPALDPGDVNRRLFEQLSGLASLLFGQTGFFDPRIPPAILSPHGAKSARSVYDTSPLRETLKALVDFDRINARTTRLTLGSVNVRLGDVVHFDNHEQEITVDHVMASGAFPPGFPPIEIEGEFYWDGGLVSNTPLAYVLDKGLKEHTLVFQVDLYDSQGPLPGNLLEVEQRRKHIIYSSRTRSNTDLYCERQRLRHVIAELFEELPPRARESAKLSRLRALGESHDIAIVHLVYRRAGYEGQDSDYEFSRRSMLEHWHAGRDDVQRTLQHRRWHKAYDGSDGVLVCDVDQDSDAACDHFSLN